MRYRGSSRGGELKDGTGPDQSLLLVRLAPTWSTPSVPSRYELSREQNFFFLSFRVNSLFSHVLILPLFPVLDALCV